MPAARPLSARDLGEGVERVRARTAADRVEVHLEAEVRQSAGRLGQLFWLDEQVSRPLRVVPVTIEVRRAHRGGEGLADAVEHQLDRGGAEEAPAVGRLPACLQG